MTQAPRPVAYPGGVVHGYEVTAGPRRPYPNEGVTVLVPHAYRQWIVTAQEWDSATETGREEIRQRCESEANEYAAELRRSGVNWVRVDWIQC